jgi:transcriptional regulator with XRE-family HTH domain
VPFDAFEEWLMRRAMQLRDRDTLRAYLRLLNLSERGLASRAGIGHATLNHLLSGRRSTCSPLTAAAIEAALACPAGLFFQSSDGRHSSQSSR